MEKILIIGGVAAGATAAAKARRVSSTAQITMLEGGPDVSFANCGLPYYIGGDIKNRSSLILQSPESFKEQYNVDVHIHTTVTSIDRKNKRVQATHGLTGEKKEFSYTKLILAQGGRPIKPTLPGSDLSHVFTLWTLDDMDKIHEFISTKKPKSAVVVGGGFIGLEMAEALAKRQLSVHVVEAMPHVMSIMEAEIAGLIQAEMESYGVRLHTGTSVREITPGEVKLDNGESISAGMVLLSIGVRPTLQLAKDSDLTLGDAGGLLVNEYLQTSDPDIYAAGDMVEIVHRVNQKKVRIPLAGPANRQGRIAAENALGGSHPYKGSIGTSVVRVFEMVAGTTGLSLKQAKSAGIDADAVTVHKEHHTSYYPDSEQVTVLLVFDRKTGVILGGQTAGYKAADKRLDVIATAVASRLTIHDLADIDFAYSPPIGTANDVLNMAAYSAENKLSGFSVSVPVSELDEFVKTHSPVILDVRDVFAFEKSHIAGAIHIPYEVLSEEMDSVPSDRPVLVYDETGKKGHQTLRKLTGAGYPRVWTVSGGHTSLQRFARAIPFTQFSLGLLPVEKKSLHAQEVKTEKKEEPVKTQEGPLVVDVRTPGEFSRGAYPGAVNIPVDELPARLAELGQDPARDITVYCASGARSAYAEGLLKQVGFTKVTNGGGLNAMMARQKKSDSPAGPAKPFIVDVRSEGEFSRGAYPGAVNIPVDELPARLAEFGSDPAREITVYCASGARSAYAEGLLKQAGYTNVTNGGGLNAMMARQKKSDAPAEPAGQLIVDVRSSYEFMGGAYPGAVNIPLDELQFNLDKLGSKSREIVVYCASGARSAYAQQMLRQLGFQNVKNGGGLMQMMRSR